MIRTRLKDALKAAQKEKDKCSVSTLRLITAALKDRDIAARCKGTMDGIDEDEVLGLLQSMVNQRRESIELYEKGGRMELAQQEAEEIAVIERFLPEQLTGAAQLQVSFSHLETVIRLHQHLEAFLYFRRILAGDHDKVRFVFATSDTTA